jgi:DNA-binding response OmpR family regulator
VPHVVIVTDSSALANSVRSVLPADQFQVSVIGSGAEVRSFAARSTIDLAVIDFQVGNMGGPAVCLDLRLEESGGRIARVPVLLTLDRRDDVFLARRSQADGWILKPLDPMRVRAAIEAVLEGHRYEDGTGAPSPTVQVDA